MSSKTTHIRIDKHILGEMKQDHPNMTTSEVIKMYRDMYKGVQKAGRVLYGKVWKK